MFDVVVRRKNLRTSNFCSGCFLAPGPGPGAGPLACGLPVTRKRLQTVKFEFRVTNKLKSTLVLVQAFVPSDMIRSLLTIFEKKNNGLAGNENLRRALCRR